eukprot:jgi/Antlo1/2175/1756
MIWIEKYRPHSFHDMESHEKITSLLQRYSLDTMPHILIYGLPGYGKKTLLYSFIRHLYGNIPNIKQRKMEITVNSGKNLEVAFIESEEFIELNLSEYGHHDKIVVQKVIKEIAQTKPMLGLFKQKKSANIRLAVITNAECLSKDAQSALRRTIELYSSTFRLILVCNQLSPIINPIKSRFLNIRMPGFSQETSASICKKILSTENIYINEQFIHEICASSAGNLRRTLCLLEVHCFNHISDENIVKRKKIDAPILHLDWERQIKSIVNLMKKEQSSNVLRKIREDLYFLLTTCISPQDILLTLLHFILDDINLKNYKSVVNYASIYDERLKLGTKSIVHLESFVASVLMLYSSSH